MRRIALLLICLCLSPLTYAETAFVGDNLRVGVRPEQGTRTAPTTVINSGEKLEILERGENYTRIKTSNGTEGWVRSIYLSKKPPAKVQIVSLEKEYKQAQRDVLTLQKELASSTEEQIEMSQKIQLLNDEIYNLHQKLAALRPDSHKAWIYMIIATLSLCGLAFTLGILWNKQQVAKKLGGHTL